MKNLPLKRRIRADEYRSRERLTHHYLVERELSDRLLVAPQDLRLQLYQQIYEELFRRVHDHPQITRKADDDRRRIVAQLRRLAPFLTANTRFLEIGAGDCRLSFMLSTLVKEVHAIDVSETISATDKTPANFAFHLTNGVSVCVPDGSIDLAYSNQLMEHLHPDDAVMQLENIFRSLDDGGRYICVTPNRLSGPHDISYYFSDKANGLHLKEYDHRDLISLMRQVGFRKIHSIVSIRTWQLLIPGDFLTMFERIHCSMPKSVREIVANSRWGRKILGVALCLVK